MLISDLTAIGNRLLVYRKKIGKTQMEIAECAGISDRSYADIERGKVSMKTDTMLKICSVMNIQPNDLYVDDCMPASDVLDSIVDKLKQYSPSQQRTAAMLLSVYLQSLDK